MIDHSEGCINLRQLLAALEDCLLRHDRATARDLCVQIIVEAKLLSTQISIEEENHGVHPPGTR